MWHARGSRWIHGDLRAAPIASERRPRVAETTTPEPERPPPLLLVGPGSPRLHGTIAPSHTPASPGVRLRPVEGSYPLFRPVIFIN